MSFGEYSAVCPVCKETFGTLFQTATLILDIGDRHEFQCPYCGTYYILVDPTRDMPGTWVFSGGYDPVFYIESKGNKIDKRDWPPEFIG